MSRLIDVDALIEQMDAEPEGGYYSPHDVISLLMTQPVVEERKKGKWKRAYLDHEAMGERPSVLYCSICNQCIAYPTNYCPNCGARMER